MAASPAPLSRTCRLALSSASLSPPPPPLLPPSLSPLPPLPLPLPLSPPSPSLPSPPPSPSPSPSANIGSPYPSRIAVSPIFLPVPPPSPYPPAPHVLFQHFLCCVVPAKTIYVGGRYAWNPWAPGVRKWKGPNKVLKGDTLVFKWKKKSNVIMLGDATDPLAAYYYNKCTVDADTSLSTVISEAKASGVAKFTIPKDSV
ncbi:unnamed protein product [Closterium sp. Yama58-4]|nr:unnamed protein product [Closterium sp. Yama58-4]